MENARLHQILIIANTSWLQKSAAQTQIEVVAFSKNWAMKKKLPTKRNLNGLKNIIDKG